MGSSQEGAFLFLQASNALDLACLPRVTLLESVGLERWTEIRSCVGEGSGAPLGGSPPPSHRLLNGKGDTLNVFPGESTRGLVGSFCRVKSGLGDVSPLLVCAGREAQAVAVCYPFPTLDTF